MNWSLWYPGVISIAIFERDNSSQRIFAGCTMTSVVIDNGGPALEFDSNEIKNQEVRKVNSTCLLSNFDTFYLNLKENVIVNLLWNQMEVWGRCVRRKSAVIFQISFSRRFCYHSSGSRKFWSLQYNCRLGLQNYILY